MSARDEKRPPHPGGPGIVLCVLGNHWAAIEDLAWPDQACVRCSRPPCFAPQPSASRDEESECF